MELSELPTEAVTKEFSGVCVRDFLCLSSKFSSHEQHFDKLAVSYTHLTLPTN